jgi:hypothetical protein
MKKSLLIIASLVLSAWASSADLENVEGTEYEGFLVSEDCMEKGSFTNCQLDSYVCGYEGCFKEAEPGVTTDERIVLYNHDENKIYKLDLSHIDRGHIDHGVNRNAVTIIGEVHGDTLVANGFKAPPPPKKSFFKGCL